jgi:hypothetical protein
MKESTETMERQTTVPATTAIQRVPVQKRKALKRSLYEMLSLFPMTNPKYIALIILKHAKYQKLDFNVHFRF